MGVLQNFLFSKDYKYSFIFVFFVFSVVDIDVLFHYTQKLNNEKYKKHEKKIRMKLLAHWWTLFGAQHRFNFGLG